MGTVKNSQTSKASAAKKPEAPAKKPSPKKENPQAASQEDKKTLESTMDFLAEARKMGIVSNVNQKIDLIPSGNWIIDRLTGDGTGTGAAGGIPRGGIIEIFGNESCGKTTLALHYAKEVLDAGGRVVFIDYERSLKFQQHYLKNLGIDTSSDSKFLVLEPNNFEEGNKMIGLAIMKMKPHLIITDSWAAAVPAAAMDAGADEATRMGLCANITSQVLPRFAKWLKQSNTALIILNQLRKNIKKSQYEPGPDEITSGGNAIRYYPTIRIELRSQGKEAVEVKSGSLTGVDEKKALNQTVKVVVVKNKMDIPWRSSPIYITFGKGIDGLRSLIELGINRRVISKTGAWFEYQSISSPACSFKKSGVQQVYAFLKERPDIVQDMMPLLMPKVDNEELRKGIKDGDVKKDDLAKLDAGLLGEELDPELAAELATLDSNSPLPMDAPDLSDI